MDLIMKTVSFVLVFGAVVFFHELGHFVLAKLNDIEVKSFMLGFGPKLLKYQGPETEYSLRLIPLGGAVVMVGEEEDDDSPRSYSNKSVWRRISVLIAGPLMNFILAIVIFIILFMRTGVMTTEVSGVIDNSPAALSGINSGDIILSVDDKPVNEWNDIPKYISESNGKESMIKVRREGEEKTFKITPELDQKDGRYLIGIKAKIDHSFFNSIGASLNRTKDISVETLMFFPKLFSTPNLVEQVSGPVGIAKIVGDVSEKGFWPLLALTAIISINLGVFNLLPIVPLDGGKILLGLIEALIRKKLNPKFEMIVSYAGVGLVLLLFVFVMYNDIVKLINGVM